MVGSRARWFVVLVTAAVLSVAGCSTYARRVRQARDDFYRGDLGSARAALDRQMADEKRDRNVVGLDLALVTLMQGQPPAAEQQMRHTRDELDALQHADVLGAGVSMLTDDQRRTYVGADYERVLLRVFLALANLMHDGGDAEAYSLQVNALQQQLLQHAQAQQLPGPDDGYQPLAVGPYLRGMLREATFHDYDDAVRAYHQVVAWQPSFRSGKLDLERAGRGQHSQQGNGVLYVFVLVDSGPIKVEAVEAPTSAALLIADRILSATGEYELPPTIAPVKVPRIAIPPRQSDGAVVVIDGQPAGMTELICDIGDLAVRQHEVQLPSIVARAVARRVVKKASVYAVKDSVNTERSPWVDLALTVAGVAWEATESADTRCWSFLPREIQTLRVELPVGSHTVQLRSLVGGSSKPVGDATPVEIVDGRNSYMLAYVVGDHVIGQPLHRSP